MRILILTQYYPPEMGAPQARLHELATRLAGMGHRLTVVTGMPNYPSGRIFDDYRWKLVLEEEVDGIRVVRTPLYPSNSTRIIPRIVSYLSFALSSLVIGSRFVNDQDVVIVESPPLFIAPSGFLIARLRRANPILMVSDIWPDILIRMGHSELSIGIRAMKRLERWAYGAYSAVALTNSGAVSQIHDRFPGVRTLVVSNGVDTRLFDPAFRRDSTRRELGAEDDTFLVGYCGLHGMAQGLEVVVAAAERLRGNPEIAIVLVGDGPVKAALVEEAERKRLANVRFFGRRAKSEMPAIVASCDAMLVPLSARLPGTMPSKVYEAMAAGTPPIVARGCEAEALVTESNCGTTFEPMDGESLATAISMLAADRSRACSMGLRAREVVKRFDRSVIAAEVERTLREIASQPK